MSGGHGTSALGIEQQDQRAPDLSGVAQTGNEDIMADLPAAIEQLKAWAQVGKLIRYESGTLLSAINFMARLEPGSDGSFLIYGALEYGAAGMCGSIYPSHVEYVRIWRQENRVAVILRRLDGSNCIVFDDGGDLEKFWKSQPATPLTN